MYLFVFSRRNLGFDNAKRSVVEAELVQTLCTAHLLLADWGVTRHMKRARALWWTPLAAHCSHVACLAPPGGRPAIYTPSGVDKAIMLGSNPGYRLAFHRGHGMRVYLSRQRRTRILQMRVSSSPSSQEKPSAGIHSSMETGDGEEPSRRRASSRYIPSDYRGVVGGPKGKWKARITSKGGVKHLGTFGCVQTIS